MTKLIEAEGFLFINDPHLSSRRPGKRTDSDYSAIGLDKVDQAIEIANRLRLVPVFGGDMFNRSREEGEEGEALKTRLLRILAKSWTTCYSNVGSHDCNGLRLSDADSLAVIAESGHIVVARDTGPVAEFMLQGMRVGLGFSPARQEIPRDITGVFPEAEGVVWVTHHDIAFEGAYPGAIEPFEIKGCSMVWNAHMHLEKPIIAKGQTSWVNCGNVMRMSVDALAHVPSVWQFSPHDGLCRQELRYVPDVFDLTGRLIEAIPTSPEAEDSEFVDLLKADIEAGPAATPDGELLLDEVQGRFERDGVPQEVRNIVLDLFRRVTDTAA